MAETIFASPIVHEVLNSDNYKEWTIRLKTYLKAHNLWDVVEKGSSSEQGKSKEVKGETSGKGKKGKTSGKEKKGETSGKGQNEKVNGEPAKQGQSVEDKNFTALHAIFISCGSDALSVIKDADSAKKAWETLKEEYGPKVVEYNSEGETFDDQEFFEAVRNIEDDWSNVEEILRKYPKEKHIVRSKHPGTDETGLHIAATAGNEKIVKELVKLMRKNDLKHKGTDKLTALAEAVFTGMKSIAECMVEKHRQIVSIAVGSEKLLPVVHALSYGCNDMANYLYHETKKQNLPPKEDFKNVAALLFWSIDAKNHGIALDMLKRFPRMAITVHEKYGSPFCTLAENPAMFPSTSTCRLNFWQRWIYDRIDGRSKYPATNDVHIDVRNQEDSQTSRKNICCAGLLKSLRSYISKLLGIEHIHNMKFGHDRTMEIVQKMCEVIKTLDDDELKDSLVVEALHKATANGMVEFFVALIQANPELLWITEKITDRHIFMLAVQHRQPKIFSLIHGLNSKQGIKAWTDSSNNTMLHMAGFLAPSSQLTSIAGPALQMQRELQWFEEVVNVISPSLKELRNLDHKTAQDLFTENHKDLKEKGEKWMKDTAQSCTVPAALIVTIMFAAAFTVPGGLIQDTGRPLLLHDKFFRLFIISDAVSLFSSAISVIMFLGILSSPYREADFLRSLPTKLMIGLFTLFLSIVAMMICFSAALLILFDGESWVIFPIILSSSLPIILYLILQFSLVFEIFKSTYGSSIFERKQRRWL